MVGAWVQMRLNSHVVSDPDLGSKVDGKPGVSHLQRRENSQWATGGGYFGVYVSKSANQVLLIDLAETRETTLELREFP